MPRRRLGPLREKEHVENPCLDHARDRWGLKHFKMSTQGPYGNTGYPDRIFFAPGEPFFIEFKKPGEEPTERQREKINELRGLGYGVFVAHTKEEGKEIIDTWMGSVERGETPARPREPLDPKAVHAKGRKVAAGTRRRRAAT